MPATMTRWFVLVLAAVALGACASMGAGAEEPYATLVIENDATMAVTVYAIREGGSRMRLGQVTGLSRGEFSLRRHMLAGTGQLQVLIDPIGSRQTHASEPIFVGEGDVIELRVSSFIR